MNAEQARRCAEEAGFVVLDRADAKWLCDWIHGEDDCDYDYDRAHLLLEGGD